MEHHFDFDPYDYIMQLQHRILALEVAHNRLAAAFQQTEAEFNIALHSVNILQSHLAKAKAEIEILKKDKTA